MEPSVLAQPDTAFSWLDDPVHRKWLTNEAIRQLKFFSGSLSPTGQFRSLNWDGSEILGKPQELHATARLIHSYALGKQVGFLGSDVIISAGLHNLEKGHKDPTHGGYIWSYNDNGPCDTVKLAYGHVFVLLAGASALQAGFEEAEKLIMEISEILDEHFWDDNVGRFKEEFNSDWSTFSNYRGMNANMHGSEALLAAYEATQDQVYLDRAGSILDFFVGTIAPQYNWRIPEHYHLDWTIDPEYHGNLMFRPAGTTPGHSFEFARLRIQHWDLSGRPDNSALVEARQLIDTALNDAWLPEGGFCYTLDDKANIKTRDRLWWPVTEAIGAISTLQRVDPRPDNEAWYRKLWEFANEYLIDHVHGGWFGAIDAENCPIETQFKGKPDIYHSLQASLIPLVAGVSYLHKNLREVL